SHRTIRRMIGWPATGIAGLARSSVSAGSRVPRPAASTSARILVVVEQHVGGGHAALVAVLQEEAAVRVGHVVGLSAAERHRRGHDALLAAFDLDERPNRRLVNRDDHVVFRELLAVLLVAEPDVKAELFEDP